MANKLRSMLDSPTAVMAFKRRYEFPKVVDIRLIRPKDNGWFENEEGTHFPLIAIVEGGLSSQSTLSFLQS